MTEENKDSTPPKLKLSRKSEEPEPEPESKAGAEREAAGDPGTAGDPAEKPDLKLRRPEPEPDSAESQNPALPPEPKPEKPSVEPTGERSFDPENPFAGIEIKKPRKESSDRRPPELPSKPQPVQDDGSGRKVEEAIGRIGEQKKSRGMLTSIIVIVLLLAILAGSGYGLYYIFQNPAEIKPSTVAEAQKPLKPEAGPESSDGPPGGPIEKAKTAIAKVPELEKELTEEEEKAPPSPDEVAETANTGERSGTAPVAGENPPPPTAAVDASMTESVSKFLQSAHIGGVRTGSNPKLILNGKSFNQGDLVDADIGLRFIGFRDEKLAFRDDQGIVYIKSF